MKKLIEAREALISALLKANEKYHESDASVFKDIINPIAKDEHGFFLSLSEEIGKVTYAKDKSSKFNEKKRVKTSFRRFLRRQLDINSNKYSDDWLDRFGCEVISFLPFDINSRIKLIKGDDIVSFYTKTFVDTCMTGKANKNKIQFYAVNEDKVELAIMDNFIRAFVWTTDEGIKVFDRIYPSGNLDAEILFRKWATSQGYKLRLNPSSVVHASEMVGIEGNVTLHVTAKRHTSYPYLDTFRFGKYINDNKVLLSNSYNEAQIIFTRANGSYNVFSICGLCKKPCINNIRAINGQNLCDECVSINYFRCCRCGAYIHQKDITPAQRYQINYHGYVYCKHCVQKF